MKKFDEMKYFLAIDIGASSGRHMLCHVENDKIKLEKIHTFENVIVQKNGVATWDTENLFENILKGIARCKDLGKIPASVSIDTWGVDFVLLDNDDKIVGDAVSYRDFRTRGIDDLVEKTITYQEIYKKTGIAKNIFNTLYQLVAIKEHHPDQFRKANDMLFTPDYFGFLLTGIKKQEYTIASTSMLLDASEKTWDTKIIDKLGLPQKFFKTLSPPGEILGRFSAKIENRVGFSSTVVLAPSHDTASAFLAVPVVEEDCNRFAYLSSGTWSLLGTESMVPIITDQGRDAGYSNEGGFEGRYRFLKNIMGLWMIQSVRRELGKKHSFAELEEMARLESEYSSCVDVNDQAFMAPKSMIAAVSDVCEKSGQDVPQNLAQTVKCIYVSLAACYAKSVADLEKITGRKIKRIHIVGGGSQDRFLNELTAKYTGVQVIAGPTEATILGNISSQMIKAGVFRDLDHARKTIANSFEFEKFNFKE